MSPTHESSPAAMHWVHLVQLNGATLKAETLVTCILKNGKMSFEGDARMIKQLEEGIVTAQGHIKPADGEPFLHALNEQFHSAYLFATQPESGEKVRPYTLPPTQTI